jgi:hypothetical protein
MMLRLNPGAGPRLYRLALVPAWALLFLALASAQTAQPTAPQGRIAGTVTDVRSVAIPDAQVTISTISAQIAKVVTDNKGNYSTELAPASYTIHVEAKGYVSQDMLLLIKANSTTDGSVKLPTTTEVQVNTEQATVQGVTTANWVPGLALDGRNFFDLAQTEPGVQIQQGSSLGPSKVGYSSISFDGRFGRTSRITVDGADINDEIVGSTTESIPISGIQAMVTQHSTLDVSNDITSTGVVNITTKSGSDAVHGDVFGLFRDSKILTAKLVEPFNPATGSFIPTPYQRNEEGGSIGGPIQRGKLYYFFSGERTLQHQTIPVSVAPPFSQFSGSYNGPFAEDTLQARLDYILSKSTTAFARFNYFKNSITDTYFPSSFQVYNSRNYARNADVGMNFDAHDITHSVRLSYLGFHNHIQDSTRGSSLAFANYPVSMNIGTFTVGPNAFAPQANLQTDYQVRYDGTKVMGNHVVRFGVSYNRIHAGGFAGSFQIAPQVFASALGQSSDPTALSLTAAQVIVGNGQGFSSTQSALGYPAGGLGPDNRLGLYIADTWKYSPSLTITSGLRWERDSGRTDSDLPAIPELNSAFAPFGNAVRQPNKNFAPQLGLVWNPKATGKTVIRIGAGLYYENVLFTNSMLDRAMRDRNGSLLATPTACAAGQALPIPTVNAGIISVDSVEGLDPLTGRSYCGDRVSQAASALAAFEEKYQAASPFSLTAKNPNFVGARLASGLNIGTGLLSPDYRTPLATQMNLGFQHEIRPGVVLTADYVRNVETHSLLGVDINHVGAARYFNPAAALSAMNLTIADCGAASLEAAIAPHGCPGIHPAVGNGAAGAATISDFVARGMGSALDTGSACFTAKDPSTGKLLGFPCAFGGVNYNYGAMNVLQPINRSLYRGFEVKLTQVTPNPYAGIKTLTLQVAYSYSKFANPMAFQGNSPPANQFITNDQDLTLQAADNDNPLKFWGRSLLDRPDQISWAANFDMNYGFHFAMIGHLFSPIETPAVIGSTGTGGQTYQTDFSGSGVGSQPLPGTTNGSFMSSLDIYGLNSYINRYNQTMAGQATPAGQVLIGSNLFTLQQLQQIGAVAPTVQPASFDQLTFPWLRTLDARVSWSHKFHDRYTIEPSIAVFNVFNIANYDLPPATTNGWLDAGSGSINSTHTLVQPGETGPESNTFRVGNGSGPFVSGTPRSMEWSLRVTF